MAVLDRVFEQLAAKPCVGMYAVICTLENRENALLAVYGNKLQIIGSWRQLCIHAGAPTTHNSKVQVVNMFSYLKKDDASGECVHRK